MKDWYLKFSLSLGQEEVDPKIDAIAGMAVAQIFFLKYLNEHPKEITERITSLDELPIEEQVKLFTQENSEKVWREYGNKITKAREKLGRYLEKL